MEMMTLETALLQLSRTLPQVLKQVRLQKQLWGNGWLHLTSYFDSEGNLYQKREQAHPSIRLGHFQLFGGGRIRRVQTRAIWSKAAKRYLSYTENQIVDDAQFFAWVNQSRDRLLDVTLHLLTDLYASVSEQKIPSPCGVEAD